MIKPNTKKVKKYKYTRKEIADKWETTIKYSGNDLIRDLLAQKEDKKECKHNWKLTPDTWGETCFYCGKQRKIKTTPSPLEIEEIEELGIENLVKPFDKFVPQYRINHSFMTTINKLIRNQKKLISLTKRNIK